MCGGGRFMCSNNDYITPYILVYKKVNDFIVPLLSLPVEFKSTFQWTFIILKN